MDGHVSRASRAFDATLSLYEEVMELPVQIIPNLPNLDDNAFWAGVKPACQGDTHCLLSKLR